MTEVITSVHGSTLYSDSAPPISTILYRPPYRNDDEACLEQDPLDENTVELFQKTAELFQKTAIENRKTFTEIFRRVPTNVVKTWAPYKARFVLIVRF